MATICLSFWFSSRSTRIASIGPPARMRSVIGNVQDAEARARHSTAELKFSPDRHGYGLAITCGAISSRKIARPFGASPATPAEFGIWRRSRWTFSESVSPVQKCPPEHSGGHLRLNVQL